MHAAHNVELQTIPSGSLHFGDDIGEREATAGLQHASRMIKKTQTPCNGTSFKGEKKVIY